MCLRRLKNHGLIETLAHGVNDSPDKLRRVEYACLTRAGADYLKKTFGPDFEVRWTPELRRSAILDNRHQMLIVDQIANLTGAFRQAGGVLELLLVDDQLRPLIADRKVLFGNFRPDAVMVVRFGDTRKVYVVEIDTGTMPVSGIARNAVDKKIPNYADYYANRFDRDPFFAGLPQPQNLFITNGPRRAEHLKDAILKAGGRRAYAVTTFAWLEPPQYSALGQVWLIPTLDGFQRLKFD